MEMLNLQNRIHQQAVDMGWWPMDKPRPQHRTYALIHSELGEMTDGDRTNIQDPKLPQYLNKWVECADFIVRSMDYLGACEFNGWDAVIQAYNETAGGKFTTDYDDADEFTCEMHSLIGSAYLTLDEQAELDLVAVAVISAWCFAVSKGVDIAEIIDAKLKFNLVRPDHQIENRNSGKPGSKSY